MIYSQHLGVSSQGSDNGTGSFQTLLSPGDYTFTIDSQLAGTASFPPGTSGSGQVDARCTLQFTPCSTTLQLSVSKNLSYDAVLSWSPGFNATSYDVVLGDLGTLGQTAGNFSLATNECLANDIGGTSLPYPDDPAAGEGFWFLVRAAQCGGVGTYDTGTPSQIGARDAEIDASGNGCAP